MLLLLLACTRGPPQGFGEPCTGGECPDGLVCDAADTASGVCTQPCSSDTACPDCQVCDDDGVCTTNGICYEM